MMLLLATAFGHGAPLKIGVLLKAKSSFWSAVEKGALEAGARLGADVVVKAPLAESDIGVQIQLLNALVRLNVQALVIAPDHRDALAAPVAAAAAKGIKVVVIDSALAGDAAHVFLGTDQRKAGEAAGALLAKLLRDGDDVVLLKHNQTGGATEQREIGASEMIHAALPHSAIHGDIYAGSEAGMELQKAQLVFEKYARARGILSSGTPGTMAMLKVLKARGLAGKIPFIGFGFNLNPEVAAALESGALKAWIAQLPKDLGTQGVETAVALAKGETRPATVTIDFVVITKDNLQDPKVQALLNL
jgi:ribose transport system substrate-binding protein